MPTMKWGDNIKTMHDITKVLVAHYYEIVLAEATCDNRSINATPVKNFANLCTKRNNQITMANSLVIDAYSLKQTCVQGSYKCFTIFLRDRPLQ